MALNFEEQVTNRLLSTAAASGTTAALAAGAKEEIVAAVSGEKIRVHGLVLSASAGTTVQILSFDGVATYTEVGRISIPAVSVAMAVLPMAVLPWCSGLTGGALYLGILAGAAAATLTYHARYTAGD